MIPSSPPHPRAGRPSWTTVYATGVPFLRKTLKLFGVAKDELEDVLQEILVAVYGALDRYDPTRYARAAEWREDEAPEEGDDATSAAAATLARSRPCATWDPLCAWLFGIAWRQVNHYRERAYRRNEVPSGLIIPAVWEQIDEQSSPEAAMVAGERAALVGEALDRLELGRRCILILHDMLDMAITEVAEQLGINPNTAHNRLRAARAEFITAVRWMGEEKRRALQLDERRPPPGDSPRRAPRRRRSRH